MNVKIIKSIQDFLDNYSLTIDKLNSLSIESNLAISLKKDLDNFDKEDVVNEFVRVTSIYSSKNLKDDYYDYRIKAINSIERKFNKYIKIGRNFKKVFDDILGFRIICKSYDDVLKLNKIGFRVIDLSHGKRVDDGYRGVHIYYQKNVKCYPIEIQVLLEKDRIFNQYLHEYIYKRNLDSSIGNKLKKLYDSGKINNVTEFKEALNDVLHIS